MEGLLDRLLLSLLQGQVLNAEIAATAGWGYSPAPLNAHSKWQHFLAISESSLISLGKTVLSMPHLCVFLCILHFFCQPFFIGLKTPTSKG